MNFFNKKKIAILIFAIFFVILDRFFKVLAIFYQNEEFQLLGDFLKFNFTKNYNIAFSLPLSGLFLKVLIFSLIIFLLFFVIHLIKKQEKNQAIWLTIVVIGAISNYVDRVLYGYVVDYLDMKYYTVFNLADVMIVGGISFFIFLNLDKKG